MTRLHHYIEPFSRCAFLASLLFIFGIPVAALSEEAARTDAVPTQVAPATAISPSLIPVYRVPLRVHLGKSGRKPPDFREIFGEINEIWLTQAGICFEIETTHTDRAAENGMDLWFMPVLSLYPLANGYYRSDHEIQVRDTPALGPADHPARHPAARTAAHELGHGLGLLHRQDSDDNLMRSKTFGWKLNSEEVLAARKTAAKKALPDNGPVRCGPPRIPLRELNTELSPTQYSGTSSDREKKLFDTDDH